MPRMIHAILLILVVLGSWLPAAQAGSAKFMRLGNLPGGFFADNVFDVSGDGTSVVGLGRFADGTWSGFRWSTTGQLDVINGETRAISTDGEVVVGQTGFGFGINHAFRWTSEGGFASLGDLPTGPNLGSAYGASADGSTIVGFSHITNNQRAFRWTTAGGMTDLGGTPGKPESWALATSADGNAVVGYVSTPGQGRYEAFLWTATDGMQGLGYLPDGWSESFANSISADGTIVVGSSHNGSKTIAYRWTEAGGMVPLDGISSASQARDISADGQTIAGMIDGNAMLWTEQSGMIHLQDYLLAHGATGLDGWWLREANAISADGLTFVGTGINPEGLTEAWMATIPEPSSWVLAALAACGAIGRFLFGRGCFGFRAQGVTFTSPRFD